MTYAALYLKTLMSNSRKTLISLDPRIVGIHSNRNRPAVRGHLPNKSLLTIF